MPRSLRFSLCNEVFGKTPFAEACASIRKTGYDGIEIAPFTLAESPAEISAAQRREYRQIIEDSGLEFVGLHWLMVSPPGLHVTTSDAALRAKSWKHIRDLIELCADLGDNGVMVFGSPKQRNTVEGMSPFEAMNNFSAGLAGVAPLAESRNVRILVESLPSDQSNVINTLAQAMEIVRQIGSPAVQTMFDTHNAVDETEPHPVLLKRYFDHIAHVHVNEIDGNAPGTGNYDFAQLFGALLELQFTGYVSVEVFDFTPGAAVIAAGALQHMTRELEVASRSSEAGRRS
jgi:D-psicose/D-tagatose/L-ribulose 3-epimerase